MQDAIRPRSEIKMLLKKISAITASAFIAIAPIQANSLVFLPLIPAAATYLVTFGGTMTTMQGALALSATAHAAVLAIHFANEGATDPQQTTLTINLDPNIPLITPEGWTAPVPPSTQPTPPNSIPRTTRYGGTYIGVVTSGHVSRDTVCDAMVTIGNNNPGANPNPRYTTGPQLISGSYYCPIKYAATTGGGTNTDNVLIQTTNTCPSGYTMSGSNCIIPTGQQNNIPKPPDGKCTIQWNGSTFANDPKDPDCSNQQQSNDMMQVETTPNTVTATNTGTKLQVTKNSDGTTSIKETKNNGNGTSTTTQADIGADGIIKGTKTQTQEGTGSLQPPVSNGGNGGEFNTDGLNQESTQSAVRQELEKINENLICDDCQLPTELSQEDIDAVQAQTQELADELGKATDDYSLFKDFGWTTWVPEFPTATCSPITGTIANKDVSWDFCPHVAKLNELIGWLMNIFGAWTITGMFFKRD